MGKETTEGTLLNYSPEDQIKLFKSLPNEAIKSTYVPSGGLDVSGRSELGLMAGQPYVSPRLINTKYFDIDPEDGVKPRNKEALAEFTMKASGKDTYTGIDGKEYKFGNKDFPFMSNKGNYIWFRPKDDGSPELLEDDPTNPEKMISLHNKGYRVLQTKGLQERQKDDFWDNMNNSWQGFQNIFLSTGALLGNEKSEYHMLTNEGDKVGMSDKFNKGIIDNILNLDIGTIANKALGTTIESAPFFLAGGVGGVGSRILGTTARALGIEQATLVKGTAELAKKWFGSSEGMLSNFKSIFKSPSKMMEPLTGFAGRTEASLAASHLTSGVMAGGSFYESARNAGLDETSSRLLGFASAPLFGYAYAKIGGANLFKMFDKATGQKIEKMLGTTLEDDLAKGIMTEIKNQGFSTDKITPDALKAGMKGYAKNRLLPALRSMGVTGVEEAGEEYIERAIEQNLEALNDLLAGKDKKLGKGKFGTSFLNAWNPADKSKIEASIMGFLSGGITMGIGKSTLGFLVNNNLQDRAFDWEKGIRGAFEAGYGKQIEQHIERLYKSGNLADNKEDASHYLDLLGKSWDDAEHTEMQRYFKEYKNDFLKKSKEEGLVSKSDGQGFKITENELLYNYLKHQTKLYKQSQDIWQQYQDEHGGLYFQPKWQEYLQKTGNLDYYQTLEETNKQVRLNAIDILARYKDVKTKVQDLTDKIASSDTDEAAKPGLISKLNNLQLDASSLQDKVMELNSGDYHKRLLDFNIHKAKMDKIRSQFPKKEDGSLDKDSDEFKTLKSQFDTQWFNAVDSERNLSNKYYRLSNVFGKDRRVISNLLNVANSWNFNDITQSLLGATEMDEEGNMGAPLNPEQEGRLKSFINDMNRDSDTATLISQFLTLPYNNLQNYHGSKIKEVKRLADTLAGVMDMGIEFISPNLFQDEFGPDGKIISEKTSPEKIQVMVSKLKELASVFHDGKEFQIDEGNNLRVSKDSGNSFSEPLKGDDLLNNFVAYLQKQTVDPESQPFYAVKEDGTQEYTNPEVASAFSFLLGDINDAKLNAELLASDADITEAHINEIKALSDHLATLKGIINNPDFKYHQASPLIAITDAILNSSLEAVSKALKFASENLSSPDKFDKFLLEREGTALDTMIENYLPQEIKDKAIGINEAVQKQFNEKDKNGKIVSLLSKIRLVQESGLKPVDFEEAMMETRQHFLDLWAAKGSQAAPFGIKDASSFDNVQSFLLNAKEETLQLLTKGSLPFSNLIYQFRDSHKDIYKLCEGMKMEGIEPEFADALSDLHTLYQLRFLLPDVDHPTNHASLYKILTDTIQKREGDRIPTIEQQYTILNLLHFYINKTNDLMYVSGYAGTGKTNMVTKLVLDILNDERLVESKPKELLYAGGNDLATDTLKELIQNSSLKGVEVREIQRDQETGTRFSFSELKTINHRKSLVLVDEAGLLTSQEAKDLYNFRDKSKIILIGDPLQVKKQEDTDNIPFFNSGISIRTDSNIPYSWNFPVQVPLSYNFRSGVKEINNLSNSFKNSFKIPPISHYSYGKMQDGRKVGVEVLSATNASQVQLQAFVAYMEELTANLKPEERPTVAFITTESDIKQKAQDAINGSVSEIKISYGKPEELQGQSFDYVFVNIPYNKTTKDKKVINRVNRDLYTAVSRAKSYVNIIGEGESDLVSPDSLKEVADTQEDKLKKLNERNNSFKVRNTFLGTQEGNLNKIEDLENQDKTVKTAIPPEDGRKEIQEFIYSNEQKNADSVIQDRNEEDYNKEKREALERNNEVEVGSQKDSTEKVKLKLIDSNHLSPDERKMHGIVNPCYLALGEDGRKVRLYERSTSVLNNSIYSSDFQAIFWRSALRYVKDYKEREKNEASELEKLPYQREGSESDESFTKRVYNLLVNRKNENAGLGRNLHELLAWMTNTDTSKTGGLPRLKTEELARKEADILTAALFHLNKYGQGAYTPFDVSNILSSAYEQVLKDSPDTELKAEVIVATTLSNTLTKESPIHVGGAIDLVALKKNQETGLSEEKHYDYKFSEKDYGKRYKDYTPQGHEVQPLVFKQLTKDARTLNEEWKDKGMTYAEKHLIEMVFRDFLKMNEEGFFMENQRLKSIERIEEDVKKLGLGKKYTIILTNPYSKNIDGTYPTTKFTFEDTERDLAIPSDIIVATLIGHFASIELNAKKIKEVNNRIQRELEEESEDYGANLQKELNEKSRKTGKQWISATYDKGKDREKSIPDHSPSLNLKRIDEKEVPLELTVLQDGNDFILVDQSGSYVATIHQKEGLRPGLRVRVENTGRGSFSKLSTKAPLLDLVQSADLFWNPKGMEADLVLDNHVRIIDTGRKDTQIYYLSYDRDGSEKIIPLDILPLGDDRGVFKSQILPMVGKLSQKWEETKTKKATWVEAKEESTGIELAPTYGELMSYLRNYLSTIYYQNQNRYSELSKYLKLKPLTFTRTEGKNPKDYVQVILNEPISAEKIDEYGSESFLDKLIRAYTDLSQVESSSILRNPVRGLKVDNEDKMGDMMVNPMDYANLITNISGIRKYRLEASVIQEENIVEEKGAEVQEPAKKSRVTFKGQKKSEKERLFFKSDEKVISETQAREEATQLINQILGENFSRYGYLGIGEKLVNSPDLFGYVKYYLDEANGGSMVDIQISTDQNGKVLSTTIKHEVFHTVFNLFVDDKIKQRVLNDARNIVGKNLSNEEAEEFLAEYFELKYRDTSYQYPDFIPQLLQNFISWMVDTLKNIWQTITLNPDLYRNIDRLMKRIEGGVYRNLVPSSTVGFERNSVKIIDRLMTNPYYLKYGFTEQEIISDYLDTKEQLLDYISLNLHNEVVFPETENHQFTTLKDVIIGSIQPAVDAFIESAKDLHPDMTVVEEKGLEDKISYAVGEVLDSFIDGKDHLLKEIDRKLQAQTKDEKNQKEVDENETIEKEEKESKQHFEIDSKFATGDLVSKELFLYLKTVPLYQWKISGKKGSKAVLEKVSEIPGIESRLYKGIENKVCNSSALIAFSYKNLSGVQSVEEMRARIQDKVDRLSNRQLNVEVDYNLSTIMSYLDFISRIHEFVVSNETNQDREIQKSVFKYKLFLNGLVSTFGSCYTPERFYTFVSSGIYSGTKFLNNITSGSELTDNFERILLDAIDKKALELSEEEKTVENYTTRFSPLNKINLQTSDDIRKGLEYIGIDPESVLIGQDDNLSIDAISSLKEKIADISDLLFKISLDEKSQFGLSILGNPNPSFSVIQLKSAISKLSYILSKNLISDSKITNVNIEGKQQSGTPPSVAIYRELNKWKNEKSSEMSAEKQYIGKNNETLKRLLKGSSVVGVYEGLKSLDATRTYAKMQYSDLIDEWMNAMYFGGIVKNRTNEGDFTGFPSYPLSIPSNSNTPLYLSSGAYYFLDKNGYNPKAKTKLIDYILECERLEKEDAFNFIQESANDSSNPSSLGSISQSYGLGKVTLTEDGIEFENSQDKNLVSKAIEKSNLIKGYHYIEKGGKISLGRFKRSFAEEDLAKSAGISLSSIKGNTNERLSTLLNLAMVKELEDLATININEELMTHLFRLKDFHFNSSTNYLKNRMMKVIVDFSGKELPEDAKDFIRQNSSNLGDTRQTLFIHLGNERYLSSVACAWWMDSLQSHYESIQILQGNMNGYKDAITANKRAKALVSTGIGINPQELQDIHFTIFKKEKVQVGEKDGNPNDAAGFQLATFEWKVWKANGGNFGMGLGDVSKPVYASNGRDNNMKYIKTSITTINPFMLETIPVTQSILSKMLGSSKVLVDYYTQVILPLWKDPNKMDASEMQVMDAVMKQFEVLKKREMKKGLPVSELAFDEDAVKTSPSGINRYKDTQDTLPFSSQPLDPTQWVYQLNPKHEVEEKMIKIVTQAIGIGGVNNSNAEEVSNIYDRLYEVAEMEIQKYLNEVIQKDAEGNPVFTETGKIKLDEEKFKSLLIEKASGVKGSERLVELLSSKGASIYLPNLVYKVEQYLASPLNSRVIDSKVLGMDFVQQPQLDDFSDSFVKEKLTNRLQSYYDFNTGAIIHRSPEEVQKLLQEHASNTVLWQGEKKLAWQKAIKNGADITGQIVDKLSADGRLDQSLIPDTILPAEVILPYPHYGRFKTYLGNKLPKTISEMRSVLTEATKGNSALQSEVLKEFEESLYLMNFRIPATDKNSNLFAKIVEFYWGTDSNIMMVPNETVIFHGSDFDVDKLRTMYQQYIKGEDSTGKKREIIDTNSITRSLMKIQTNPMNAQAIFNPISFDRINGYIKSMLVKKGAMKADESLDSYKARASSFYSPVSQVNFHQDNMEGASLVGIFATASKVYSYLFQSKLSLGNKSFTFNYEGRSIPINGIGSIYDNNGFSITDNFSIMTNASIDTVKEKILPYMNANGYTASAITAMISVGLDLETITNFMNEPEILKLTDKLKKGAGLSSGIEFNQVQSMIGLIKNELTQANKSVDNLTYFENFLDISKSIDVYRTITSLNQEIKPTFFEAEKTEKAIKDYTKGRETLDSIIQKTETLISNFPIEGPYSNEVGNPEDTKINDQIEGNEEVKNLVRFLYRNRHFLAYLDALKVYGDLSDGMLKSSPLYKDIYKKTMDLLGISSNKQENTALKDKFFSSFVTYLAWEDKSTMIGNINLDTVDKKAWFLITFPSIVEKLKVKYKGNNFMEGIRVSKGTVVFNKNSVLNSETERLISSDFARMDAKDKQIFAVYNVLKEGTRFGYGSYASFVQPEYFSFFTDKIKEFTQTGQREGGIDKEGNSGLDLNLLASFFAQQNPQVLGSGKGLYTKKKSSKGSSYYIRTKDQSGTDINLYPKYGENLFVPGAFLEINPNTWLLPSQFSYLSGMLALDQSPEGVKTEQFRRSILNSDMVKSALSEGKELKTYNRYGIPVDMKIEGNEGEYKRSITVKVSETGKTKLGELISFLTDLSSEATIPGIKYQVRDRQEEKVLGREGLERLSSYLQSIFPAISFRIFSEKDLKNGYYKGNTRIPVPSDVMGFTHNGTVYLNEDKATIETPLHEYGHIFVGILKNKNERLYKSLIQEASKTQLFNNIKQIYSSLNLGEEALMEETLVTALSEYLKGNPDYIRLSKENPIITRTFLQKVKEWIKKILDFFGLTRPIKSLSSSDINYLFGREGLSSMTMGRFNEITDLLFSGKEKVLSQKIKSEKLQKEKIQKDGKVRYQLSAKEDIGIQETADLIVYPKKSEFSQKMDKEIESFMLENETVMNFFSAAQERRDFIGMKSNILRYTVSNFIEMGITDLRTFSSPKIYTPGLNDFSILSDDSKIRIKSSGFITVKRDEESGKEVLDFIIQSNDSGRTNLQPTLKSGIVETIDTSRKDSPIFRSILKGLINVLAYRLANPDTVIGNLIIVQNNPGQDRDSMAHASIYNESISGDAQIKAAMDLIKKHFYKLSPDFVDKNAKLFDPKSDVYKHKTRIQKQIDNLSSDADKNAFEKATLRKMSQLSRLVIQKKTNPDTASSSNIYTSEMQRDAKDILEALEVELEGDYSDTNKYTAYMTHMSNSGNPIIEYIANEFYIKDQLVRNDFEDVYKKHKTLVTALKKELNLKGEALFDWMFERDETGKKTGNLKGYSQIEALSETQKKYYTFVQTEMKRALKEAYGGFEGSFSEWYTDNFVPRFVDRSLFEKLKKEAGEKGLTKTVTDRLGSVLRKVTSIQGWKDMWRDVKDFSFITWDVNNVEDGGMMRLRGKPNNGVSEDIMSYNMEDVFLQFMEGAFKKKHMDNLLQKAYVGLTFLSAKKTSKGTVAENNMKILEHIITNNILGGKEDLGAGLERPDGSKISGYDIIRNINSYINLSFMGFNIESALRNGFHGTAENIIASICQLARDKGDIQFTPQTGAKAFGMVMAESATIIKNMGLGFMDEETKGKKTKIELLMEKFNVIDNHYMLGLKKGLASKENSLIQSKHLYVAHKVTEWVNQATMLLAQMLHDNTWDDYEVDENNNLVFTGKGRGSTFNEAQLEARLKAKLIPVSATSEQSEGLNKESMKELSTDEVRRYLLTIGHIHGLYRKSEAVMLEASILGKMMMMFKKWVPITLGRTFNLSTYENKGLGKFEYIENEDGTLSIQKKGQIIEGRVKAIPDLFSLLFGFVVNPKGAIKKLSELPSHKRENMAKISADLATLGMLSLIGAALFEPEERRKKKKAFWVNVWDGTWREISTPYNPLELLKLTDNPFVQINQLNHVFQLFAYSVMPFSENSYNQRTGEWKGINQLGALIPFHHLGGQLAETGILGSEIKDWHKKHFQE